jgi:hypothetical protein
MDRSPGNVIIISLMLATAFSTCTVAYAYSLPSGRTAEPGLIASVPGSSDDAPAARQVHAIDDSFNGRIVRVAPGDVLLVKLREYDSEQSWRFIDDNGFSLISDVVLQTYPEQHSFRVKASRPGELNFDLIDRNNGSVIDTFSVTVVFDSKKSADKRTMPHPLRMTDRNALYTNSVIFGAR